MDTLTVCIIVRVTAYWYLIEFYFKGEIFIKVGSFTLYNRIYFLFVQKLSNNWYSLSNSIIAQFHVGKSGSVQSVVVFGCNCKDLEVFHPCCKQTNDMIIVKLILKVSEEELSSHHIMMMTHELHQKVTECDTTSDCQTGSRIYTYEYRIQNIHPWQVAETRGKNVRCIQINKRLLPVSLAGDFMIGQFVICPLVTMCWRSVWMTGDWVVDR